MYIHSTLELADCILKVASARETASVSFAHAVDGACPPGLRRVVYIMMAHAYHESVEWAKTIVMPRDIAPDASGKEEGPAPSRPVKATDPLDGAALIREERYRQIEEEGFSATHDAYYQFGTLASAAMCYLARSMRPSQTESLLAVWWPWDRKWWKPAGNLRNLVKAGALIAAEIDRLLKDPSGTRNKD